MGLYELISMLLTIGRVNDKNKKIFMSQINMLVFNKALTHKSYIASPKFNSKLLKYVGDPIYDACVVDYIESNLYIVTAESWKTKLKHYLQINQQIIEYINKWDLIKYCRYDPNMYIEYGESIPDKVIHYTIRAILGAIVKVVTKTETFGTAYKIVYNIMSHIFNNINIKLDYETIVDPKTRLTDLLRKYTGNEKLNMKHYYSVVTENLNPDHLPDFQGTTRNYTITVKVPLPNPTSPLKEIITQSGHNVSRLENDTSQKAINILNKMGIKHIPFVVNEQLIHPIIPRTDVETEDGFHSMIRKQLLLVMNQKHVDIVTNPTYMNLFIMAFTHKSKSYRYSYEKLEFYGDTIVNLTMANVIQRKIPQVINSKYITRIKQNLYSTASLSSIAKKLGFDRYILADTKITDNIIEDVFESFFGALAKILTINYGNGVSVGVCQELMYKYTEKIPISLNYYEMYGPKSILKEIYDKQNWKPFDDNVFKVYYDKTREIWVGYAGAYLLGYGVKPQNLMTIVTLQRDTEKEAIHDTAMMAINYLGTTYNIFADIPSPYVT